MSEVDAVADEQTGGEGVELRLVGVIVVKVLQESLRDRWFWLYTIGFAALAASLTLVAVPDSSVVLSGGFGRTGAALVALVQLVVVLMAISLGARVLASERESGSLAFVLSQPISRTEVLLGTFVGLGGALLAALAAGFGVAGVLSTMRDAPVTASVLINLTVLSWLLSLCSVAIGLVIGVSQRKVGAATSTALFVWFLLVFIGDLGIMGSVLASRLPVESLFLTAVLNPVEAFRLAVIVTLDGSLDALGPAGTYAVDTYGDGVGVIAVGVLVAWVVAPLTLAWLVFRRGTDL
ncbi:MAG: ABC transporter permease subunit [Actinomycetia bacterium]|nr:ABC transporter permease subunit [Actinomycetes bacterium]MCP4087387.1 ABC transporter permease subunit [Actinomycetes bacterium]